MAASAVPAIIDALVIVAGQVPNCLALDGFGISGDPGDFLMVGVEDADLDGWASSATAEQSWAGVGYSARSETGEIVCAARTWNGNANQKAARDAAYAIAAKFAEVLWADPTIGLGPTITVQFGKRQTFNQGQFEDGAAAQLIFNVDFMATRV